MVISVSTFIGQLGKLGTEPGLEHGAAARQLLVERGLDDATVAQAQAALDRMGELEQAPPTPGASPAERKAAEQALWSWYLEWSAVARSAIEEFRALAQAGFPRRSRRARRRTGQRRGAVGGGAERAEATNLALTRRRTGPANSAAWRLAGSGAWWQWCVWRRWGRRAPGRRTVAETHAPAAQRAWSLAVPLASLPPRVYRRALDFLELRRRERSTRPGARRGSAARCRCIDRTRRRPPTTSSACARPTARLPAGSCCRPPGATTRRRS